MSNNQLIITLIGIAVLLLIAFAVAILLRKRNESRLVALEEKKEELYNLPVNDEVEVVKNMHLIGQSQVAFREWNQKWVDLSLNSFADIENNLFEAEGYNNSFRFLKAKHQIDQIESQIELVEEDIAAIRNALSDLEKQESKNSGRVLHALDLFEKLQNTVAEDSEKYGQALPEIEKQLENILDVPQFVRSMVMVKKATAQANGALGAIKPEIALPWLTIHLFSTRHTPEVSSTRKYQSY